MRHGLTAEPVIATLEDEEDYKPFELSVTSGFDAPTAVECELVLRLASLLWRLRRATAIDTGLLQLQSEIIGQLRRLPAREARVNEHDTNETAVWTGGTPPSRQLDLQWSNNRSDSTVRYIAQNNPNEADETSDVSSTDIARCFLLRLANLDNGAFERANCYETALWRQIGQIQRVLR